MEWPLPGFLQSANTSSSRQTEQKTTTATKGAQVRDRAREARGRGAGASVRRVEGRQSGPSKSELCNEGERDAQGERPLGSLLELSRNELLNPPGMHQ